MKHRIAVISIIASVFILGTLLAVILPKKNTGAKAADEKKTGISVEETVPAQEPAAESEPESIEGEAVETASEEAEGTASEVPAEPEPQILEEYSEILKINPYVSGWLRTEDHVIDSPVVYTPGSQNYFLHRDIAGNDNSTGTLFIAINWREGFNNTLIYGHNMKDGSGFGSLSKFADRSYGLKNHTLYFDTLTEPRQYELFAAFYSQIEEEELETEEDRETADKTIEEKAIAKKEEEQEAEQASEPEEPAEPIEPVTPEQLTLNDIDLHRDFGDEDIFRFEKDEDNGRFRYYYYTDLANRDDFEYFVKNVKERALYDTGVEPEWGDDLITLSTCSYQVKNGRFVVVGVRKK